jgi:hypothetical protein
MDVADKLGVTTATVSKVWEQYCMTNDLAPKHGGGIEEVCQTGISS